MLFYCFSVNIGQGFTNMGTILSVLLLCSMVILQNWQGFPTDIYLFKANNRNTRRRYEICSKSTLKTPERHHDVVLVSLLLTLNIY